MIFVALVQLQREILVVFDPLPPLDNNSQKKEGDPMKFVKDFFKSVLQ